MNNANIHVQYVCMAAGEFVLTSISIVQFLMKLSVFKLDKIIYSSAIKQHMGVERNIDFKSTFVITCVICG